MAENPTAEISQETWRFFNQMKTYPREPIGEVIDRFTECLHSDELREQLAEKDSDREWADKVLTILRGETK